jgi:Neuraminidase-like domain/Salmonella virulence plasmid 28.1kDa A protein
MPTIELSPRPPQEPKVTYNIAGTVTSAVRASVGKLQVQLVDKNIGADQTVTDTTTAMDGTYTFKDLDLTAVLAKHGKTSPDLQVRVLLGGKLLATSLVRFNASTAVNLNVQLPDDAVGLPSEYETLMDGLRVYYSDKLSVLKETANQQDITYLANRSGWDARLVALSALASRLSEAGAVAGQTGGAVPTKEVAVKPPLQAGAQPLPPELYYALLRAGLPTDARLFRTSVASVQSIWEKALAQGVIPANLKDSLQPALETYRQTQAARALTATTAGVSTLQQMLLSAFNDPSKQLQFAQLVSLYQDNWDGFWPAVERQLPQQAAELQLLGKLYYLTLDNVPLVNALRNAEAAQPITSPIALATRGYYDPAKWQPLIGTSIPASIGGSTDAERLNNYAQRLAAQVRIAFPTAVVADKLRSGILPLPDTPQAASNVAAFLNSHAQDFDVGAESIDTFIARSRIGGTAPEVLNHVRRIQRVYQLTPDDDSMAVLLRRGLDSAAAITRSDEATFVRRLSADLGGADQARKLYARATQIAAATANVLIQYIGSRLAPVFGGTLPVQSSQASPSVPTDYSLPATATLEDLFGSLDYCACSDCGSILSPAAYLVMLMNFIDRPTAAEGFRNPQEVLFERRPDLQYLALTCENTNTALPYIDIVNETLEFYVANGLSLAAYQGHDTDDFTTSPELLANPQYVNDVAYDALRSIVFPDPLPFNRPLELLRAQLQSMGVYLVDAMIALRSSDALNNTSTPTSYGWSDILIEQLGLSREEFRIFTDSSLDVGDLYGLPNATAVQTLQQKTSLQAFSRRVAVSYDDLVAILQTQFINPNAVLLPKLQRLNASFSVVKTLHDTLNTPQSIASQFIAALPAGLDATRYGGQSPTDYQAVVDWVTGDKVYPRIMRLITITNPAGSADDCSGTVLQLRYSDPNVAHNLLSSTDFIKLIRFIRLWRKLAPLLGSGDSAVTIALTDAMLAALYPAADLPVELPGQPVDPASRVMLDAGFKAFLMRSGFLFQILNRLSLTPTAALTRLLACWAPLGMVGTQSLYSKMFLTPTILQQIPRAQFALVSDGINTNDVLTAALNGLQIKPYKVVAGDTAANVAAAIAANINATTDPDPVSNVALNTRFVATSTGSTVLVEAGFTLACQSSTPGLTYQSNAGGSQVSRGATVGGAIAAGTVLKTMIDGLEIDYTVVAGDTLNSIAAGIAAAVNAATDPDPYSGLPLNTLVAVTSAGAVVTFTAVNGGAPFKLNCAYAPAGAGTYTAGPFAPACWKTTVAGAIQPGDKVVTTINSVAVSYTVQATDVDAATLARSVASAINATAQNDPSSAIPLNALVFATSNANVVIINAVDPATAFSVTCSVGPGAEDYVAAGPFAATQTVTLAGSIPADTALRTTINGLDLVTAVAQNNLAAIATQIAASVNATTTTESTTNLPLNSLLKATANGPTVTFIATSPTIPFLLSVSLQTGAFTSALLPSPFAGDGYGAYLTDSSQKLFGYEPQLRAAFNLTGPQFALIAAELGFDASTPLTLDNISAFFRFGWLAHSLKLSVAEFLLLRKLTQLDPFAPLDPGATAPAEPPAIRLIRLVQALRTTGLQPVQALYLMWNQDITGKAALAFADIAQLALTLRTDLATVDSQFTIRDDPDGALAQRLMALVYDTATADFFFALLNDALDTSVPFSNPPGVTSLPDVLVARSANRLQYDDLSKQLSFVGFLDQTTRDDLVGQLKVATDDTLDNTAAGNAVVFQPAAMTNIRPGSVLILDSGPAQETVIVSSTTATTFTAAAVNAHDGTGVAFAIKNDPSLTNALTALAAASAQAVAPFLDAHPDLNTLFKAYIASTDPVAVKRAALLSALLQTLKQTRKEQQALGAITGAVNLDASFGQPLLGTATAIHAAADATLAAVSDLTALESGGLTARFFFTNDPTAAPDQVKDSGQTLAYSQTATVGAAITAGDVLTTRINGVAIAYTVVSADTSLALLAGHIAAALNSATSPDPGSTLPINQLIVASSEGAVISIRPRAATGANGAVALECLPALGATETYVAGSELPTARGGALIAGSWSGYINVPQSGFYDFAVAADAGAAVVLLINGAPVTLAAGTGGVLFNQSPVQLAAGSLVPVTLTVRSIKKGLLVSWKTLGSGWQGIPTESLYAATLIDRLGRTYKRFLCAASLANSCSLSADELAYINTFPEVAAAGSQATPQIGHGWLNFLGDAQNPNSLDLLLSAALGRTLQVLLDYARLKQALAPTDERLLQVLRNPGARTTDTLTAPLPPTVPVPSSQSLLLSLTGWSVGSVNALLSHFFHTSASGSLRKIENLRRVYDANTILQTCRVSAPALLAAVTNSPTAATVTALQSAVRALYAEADWLNVIRPINDAMRIRQRDALVAYILQRMADAYASTLINVVTTAVAGTGTTQLSCNTTAGITVGMGVQGVNVARGTFVTAMAGNAVTVSSGVLSTLTVGWGLTFAPANVTVVRTVDDLFQYFLIDPQTQPAVQTSRIRIALSSVQLFIERIVRNLEPAVSAVDIDMDQWQVLKRYRVAQANLEVFLWPENWAYPEVRDDASPFFQEMMDSLLQSDITDDAASAAYLDYMTDLEEVAKLQPCGMYYQPGASDTNEATYVVARTSVAPRRHYCRQLLNGSWTPWTLVKIDCEDMPITPVVWNGRLFLFWLKALTQTALAPVRPTPPAPQSNTGQSNQAPPAAIPSQHPDFPKLTDSTTGDILYAIPDSGANALPTLPSSGSSTTAAGSGTAVLTPSSPNTVTALLCWCEFYNGKWQPAKTSDATRPTFIGQYAGSGIDSFASERDRFRVVPLRFTGAPPIIGDNKVITLPDGTTTVQHMELNAVESPTGLEEALILGIQPPPPTDMTSAQVLISPGTGFVLYNTHSLPVRMEDVEVIWKVGFPQNDVERWSLSKSLTVAAPARTLLPSLPYSGGTPSSDFTFTINYYANQLEIQTSAPGFSIPLLTSNHTARFADVQPALSNAWDAPFIYEDQLYLFYVKTTEDLATVGNYPGFGVTYKPGWTQIATQSIPMLVLDQKGPGPRSAANAAAILGPGTDPRVLQKYVAALGPNIRTTFASSVAVTYDGVPISFVGSIPATPATTPTGVVS